VGECGRPCCGREDSWPGQGLNAEVGEGPPQDGCAYPSVKRQRTGTGTARNMVVELLLFESRARSARKLAGASSSERPPAAGNIGCGFQLSSKIQQAQRGRV
jgi:hypothetical protein